MKSHQLSASSFADKIGVQRSSVSHIISKRNKPSLDFLLKINETFDEVSLNWLVLGMEDSTQRPTLKEINSQADNNISPIDFKVNHKSNTSNESISNIKEIIHLYEDGSFSVFHPKRT